MNKDKHTLPPNNDLSVNKPRGCKPRNALVFTSIALGLAISLGLGMSVGLKDTADSTDAPSETMPSSTVQSQLASKAVNLAGNLAELRSNLSQLGIEFVEVLELGDHHVTGLIAIKAKVADGRIMPLFATMDGKYLAPALINMKTREDLVQKLNQDLQMDSGVERLAYDKDWDRLADSNYIAMGSDNPTRIVYITHDPYCPHCSRLWADKEKLGIPDGTQVRLIPVGLQAAQSNHVVAHWFDLQTKGGDAGAVASIRKHESLRESGKNDGIYDTIDVSSLSTASAAKDSFNKKHLMAFGANGTPTLFYKDLVTGETDVLRGRPRDLLTLKMVLGHH